MRLIAWWVICLSPWAYARWHWESIKVWLNEDGEYEDYIIEYATSALGRPVASRPVVIEFYDKFFRKEGRA